MGKSLYLKYRPCKLSDLVGQSHVARIIENTVKQNKLSHAYLFTGLHGTGKTTLARIMALIVNCENGPSIDYDVESPICKAIISGTCPDVVELDAASNTSIDDIREIRKSAYQSPMMCAKRIFIIDEVHCLKGPAASALLKILEEPPPSAMFILATTDPHKIIETILSRCQRINLNKIMIKDIVEHLEMISKKEGVEKADRAVMELIAKSARGSMRNAISILDAIIGRCGKDIDFESVKDILGSTSQKFLIDLTSAMMACDYGQSTKLLFQETNKGTDPKKIVTDLMEYFSDILICKSLGSYKHLYIDEGIKKEWLAHYEKLDHQDLIMGVRTITDYLAKSQYVPRLDLLANACILEIINRKVILKNKK